MMEPLRIIPFKVDNVHVYIKCPYCKKTHRHGSCGGKGYGGMRTPHCSGDDFGKHPDYFIVELGSDPK